MSEAPEDIRAMALQAILAGGVPCTGGQLHLAIAEVIMAERERCALLIETWRQKGIAIQFVAMGKAIRSGATSSGQ